SAGGDRSFHRGLPAGDAPVENGVRAGVLRMSEFPVAQTIEANGVRFSVHRSDPETSYGQRPVVLLHGVPETALMWQALFAELARDRTVLAPDLKGMGASEVKPPYDVPTLVDELAALIRCQVDGPVD